MDGAGDAERQAWRDTDQQRMMSFLTTAPPAAGLLKGALLRKYMCSVSLFVFGGLFVVLCIFIMVGAMYLGSAWRPQTQNLGVQINNADAGVNLPLGNGNFTYVNLGAQIVQAMRAARTPDYDNPVAKFDVINTPGVEHLDNLRHKVRTERFWGAVQIPANFTLNYLLAIRGLTNYTNNNLTLMLNSGRQQSGTNALNAALSSLLRSINSGFALAAPSRFPFNLNTAAINAVVNPVSFQTETFFVSPQGTNFMVAMGLFLMWSFLGPLIANAWQAWHGIGRFLAPIVSASLRLFTVLFQGLIISLTLTIMWAAFGTGFYHGFGATWMFLWLTAVTFQTMIIFFARGLGMIGIIILPVISIGSVVLAGSFLPVEMVGPFYSWGDGFPWTHGLQGLRNLVLGSPGCCGRLGLNIGVLFIWAGFFLLLSTLLWIGKIQAFLHRLTHPDTPVGRVLVALSSMKGSEVTVGGG